MLSISIANVSRNVRESRAQPISSDFGRRTSRLSGAGAGCGAGVGVDISRPLTDFPFGSILYFKPDNSIHAPNREESRPASKSESELELESLLLPPMPMPMPYGPSAHANMLLNWFTANGACTLPSRN